MISRDDYRNAAEVAIVGPYRRLFDNQDTSQLSKVLGQAKLGAIRPPATASLSGAARRRVLFGTNLTTGGFSPDTPYPLIPRDKTSLQSPFQLNNESGGGAAFIDRIAVEVALPNFDGALYNQVMRQLRAFGYIGFRTPDSNTPQYLPLSRYLVPDQGASGVAYNDVTNAGIYSMPAPQPLVRLVPVECDGSLPFFSDLPENLWFESEVQIFDGNITLLMYGDALLVNNGLRRTAEGNLEGCAGAGELPIAGFDRTIEQDAQPMMGIR